MGGAGRLIAELVVIGFVHGAFRFTRLFAVAR